MAGVGIPAPKPPLPTEQAARQGLAVVLNIHHRESRSSYRRLLQQNLHITDAYGRVQEVHGAGVVGEQPILQPGQSYEYTSGTPLPTPSGVMRGSYEMESERGERFEIVVAAFSLDSPYESTRIN